MNEIIIDKEFKELLPPLDTETYKSLEENIIANGCMYPLVTWNGILIDGHNRYAICTENDIPFQVTEIEFNTREDVIIWIIGNQVARRNLTPIQLTYFRGLHYNTVKGKRGNISGINQFTKEPEEKYKNYTFPEDSETVTAENLSKQYKVSRPTIFNDAKATKAIDAIGKAIPEAKTKILSGDVQIEKKELQRLASATDDEVQSVARDIVSGTYEKPRNVKDNSDNNENTATAEDITIYQPGNHGSGGMQQPSVQSANQSFNTEFNEAYKTFINTTAGEGKPIIRTALRVYIDELEDIYMHI